MGYYSHREKAYAGKQAEELRDVFELARAQPDRLNEFDRKFIPGCQERLDGGRLLTPKQVEVLDAIRKREQAYAQFQGVCQALAVHVARLPSDVAEKLSGIQNFAATPGFMVTERQVAWVTSILAVVRYAASKAAGEVAWDADVVVARAVTALQADPFLPKAQISKVAGLAATLKERGAFRLFPSEVEFLVYLESRVAEAQGEFEKYRVHVALRLDELDERKDELTQEEQALLIDCRSRLDCGKRLTPVKSQSLMNLLARMG